MPVYAANLWAPWGKGQTPLIFSPPAWGLTYNRCSKSQVNGFFFLIPWIRLKRQLQSFELCYFHCVVFYKVSFFLLLQMTHSWGRSCISKYSISLHQIFWKSVHKCSSLKPKAWGAFVIPQLSAEWWNAKDVLEPLWLLQSIQREMGGWKIKITILTLATCAECFKKNGSECWTFG